MKGEGKEADGEREKQQHLWALTRRNKRLEGAGERERGAGEGGGEREREREGGERRER